MRICRFQNNHFGIAKGDEVFDITSHLPIETDEPALWLMNQSSEKIDALCANAKKLNISELSLLSPIIKPGKVVAAPINYKAHVEEMLSNGQAFGHIQTDIKKAGLFLKASSSVVGPSEGIAQRFLDRRTDHEIELCAIIGKTADRVSAKNALSFVAGWCLGLDITVRGPEDRSFRKSIDSYCVLGPWITSSDEDIDPTNLQLQLYVDNEKRQDANTNDMVMSVAELIEYASMFYTLQPGDVIMTGTPQGVGPILPGVILKATGTGLGTMETHVRAG
jgi:2,4-diketo-3-deoxy-L-fuconate hydrolase